MAELAKVHRERLEELKKLVEEGRQSNSENVDRFEKFVKFVFKTSLNQDAEATLNEMGFPTLEFNILESIISKKRGDFAKQQPSLSVRAADGIPLTMLDKKFTDTLDVIEAHLRAIFFDGANDMLDYDVYTDLLAGGWSVLRVFTEYVNEMSFEQNICVERVYNPVLTVFDPMARKSHKGDGRFAAELYPMTETQFKDEFGEDLAKEIKYSQSNSGFQWCYPGEREKIILVCDFYEKKKKKATIYKLTNGHSVTKDEYEDFLQRWQEEGVLAQPPAIISQRNTMIEYICRYRFCDSKVLDYVETNFKYLPLVYVDGNSIDINDRGTYTKMTRPYVYHAEGIQRLKNFAGQSLANELENTIQHKFTMAIESVPEDYEDPLRNIQQADVVLYNYLHPEDKSIVLPPPTVISRTPIPPEITNTFKMTDEMTQAILGNYDTSANMTQAPMSGIAFARSAIQSDGASVPYLVGYIKGLNRVAQIIVDLIPKYYRTPRSLPVLLPNGKRKFMEINRKGSLYMNYDPNNLQVKVEMGVNFAMQKEIALQTVIGMSQANDGFKAFFNAEGLPVILDNIEMRGIDQLKEKANEWMKEQAVIQKQAQQQQMQQAQLESKKQALEIAGMQKELQSPTDADVGVMVVQQKAQTDAANLDLKQRSEDTKFLQVISQIRDSDVQNQLKAAEIDAENTRSSVESAVKIGEHINNTLERRAENHASQ